MRHNCIVIGASIGLPVHNFAQLAHLLATKHSRKKCRTAEVGTRFQARGHHAEPNKYPRDQVTLHADAILVPALQTWMLYLGHLWAT
eukprot:1622889-Pleurochrysis_carterae.AAC.1